MRAKHLAIMLTDIKGFTSRTAAQSRAKTVALLKKHEELVLPVIAEFSGTLVKSIGDAFLATFESPTDAVLCGLAIQDVLKAYNGTCGPDEKIEIRVALNSGEVSLAEDGDIYGDAVNATARLEGITEAGEVFITEAVYLTMNRNEAGFQDTGYHSFKGIPEKIRVYKVLREKPAGGNCPEEKSREAAEPETDATGPVSEKHRAEARKCFEKGLREYFNKLEFANAISAMKETIDIDPYFLDAYFLFAMFAKTVGDDVTVFSVLKKLKILRPAMTDPASLSKIDIITGRFEFDPELSRMIAKFSRRYPDDIFIHFVSFFNADGDIAGTQAASQVIRQVYPFIEDIAAPYTLAEYEYYRHGNIGRAIEIFEGLIARKQDNVNLRLGLLRMLMNAGRLDEAAAHIEESLKISPANENLQMFAAESAFLKKNINAWVTHMGKLLTLTQHSDSYNSSLYYQLYRASIAAGKEADAEKQLALSRKLGPEWDWQSAAETKSSMGSLKLKDNLFDLSRSVLDVLTEKIADWNYSEWLNNRLCDSRGVTMDLYIAGKNAAEFRHVKIWTSYVISLRKTRKGSVFIDAIPNSAFFNEHGDIIKCRFSEISATWGQHMGVLTYQEPLQRHRIEFLAAEMDAEDPGEDDFFRIENLNRSRGTHCYIFVLPADFPQKALSQEPDGALNAEDCKIIVYSRFLYAFQTFRLDLPL